MSFFEKRQGDPECFNVFPQKTNRFSKERVIVESAGTKENEDAVVAPYNEVKDDLDNEQKCYLNVTVSKHQ